MTTSNQNTRPAWPTLAVTGFFGLFFAYAVWSAVANLVTLASLDGGLSMGGWVTSLFAVLFPILVFVLAFALGQKRQLAHLTLVMLSGLGIVAVFWLSLIGYTLLNLASLTNAH